MGKLVKFSLLLALIVFASCTQKPHRKSTVYRYTVVDKKEQVASHYNILTEKQVVGTEYYIILRNDDGDIVTHEVPLRDYYKFEVGKTYKFNYPIY